MKSKVVQLNKQEFGDDVTTKEVSFLRLVDKELGNSALGQIVSIPASLADRIRILREKARRNLEAEAREM